jgi:putative transposase
VALVKGSYYHVFNKSIAGFEIFRSRDEFLRMRDAWRFYKTSLPLRSFSPSLKLGKAWDASYHGPARVRIVAYCIMPTHFHLFIQQLNKDGISKFLQFVSHGYAAYFNKKIRRIGHLWASKFKSVLVDRDAYAQHLTRYIHLNPVTAGLVDRPESWEFSSYHEYLDPPGDGGLCEIKNFGMTPEMVRRFTEDRADYQRSLQQIKHLLFD